MIKHINPYLDKSIKKLNIELWSSVKDWDKKNVVDIFLCLYKSGKIYIGKDTATDYGVPFDNYKISIEAPLEGLTGNYKEIKNVKEAKKAYIRWAINKKTQAEVNKDTTALENWIEIQNSKIRDEFKRI